MGGPSPAKWWIARGAALRSFRLERRRRCKALAPGGYFVRIYKSSGELLREYALTVKR
jgi:hypothetical protein